MTTRFYQPERLPQRVLLERSEDKSGQIGEFGDTESKGALITSMDKNGHRERVVVPSAIWTAGVLYHAYYIGEVMRVFDVADVILTRWTNGQLVIDDERTVITMERMLKKRDRRLSSEERGELYRRVFSFGESKSSQYSWVNESFPSDWNRMVKGVVAYQREQAAARMDMALAARGLIFQTTREIQYNLSEIMAGTAYLMAAEVFTMLRESSDLLRSDEIVSQYGQLGKGMNSVIEHIAAEEYNDCLPTDLLTRLAESGCHILQDWVAKFNEQSLEEGALNHLVILAQEWRTARNGLAGLML